MGKWGPIGPLFFYINFSIQNKPPSETYLVFLQ